MSDTEAGHVSVLGAFSPTENKLNILLLAVPVTCYFAYVSHDESMAFFASLVAIMPLAFLMGRATEEIALYTSESLGGLLNATFGNAAEMIIALLAIYAASQAASGSDTETLMVGLVQASLIGSILGNLLLVMGLAFLWGGVLLLLYGLFLYFQFKSHVDLFATETHHHEAPEMTKKDAIILLVVATILVSWMAEVLVHSVEYAADDMGLPHLFIGVILLPLFGNAAEHFTAVVVAGKDKMDLSFAISMGSSTQIAVFVAPVMILVAWAMNVPLTFEFGMLETVAAFLSVLIVNVIAADGKSNWLEGALLLGTYIVLGAAFLVHP